MKNIWDSKSVHLETDENMDLETWRRLKGFVEILRPQYDVQVYGPFISGTFDIATEDGLKSFHNAMATSS